MGVSPRDALFVHSDVRSALRVEGATAREKMANVLTGLRGAVPDGTLILPTFTYSFCRGEDFDVDATPSTVGVLTEEFRSRPGVRRTPEPIFSTAIDGPLPPEWEERLLAAGDHDAFGPASIFAYLREVDAKLLFFGVGFEYATFVHHVEQLLEVPYRYFKDFHGAVSAGDVTQRVTARYFVRDLEGDVEVYLDALADVLVRDGTAEIRSLPDGPELLLTSASAVETAVRREIAANPDFLLRRGHPALDGTPV